MLKRLTLVYILMQTLAIHSIAAAEDDWPQLLGPNRNGVSSETGLLNRWPDDGPTVIWRAATEGSMSGISISRGRLFTMTQTDGQQRVICLDALSGKPIWQTPVATAYENGQGNGPRATPTIEGESVFVYSGEGILAALDFANGKVVWSQDVVKSNGGKTAEYGMACSPLVVGDNVVVHIGAPKATVAAYNRVSGELVWNTDSGDSAGYSSPVLLEVGGRKQIVAFTGSSLLGIDTATGTELWRYPYKTDYDCNIATPIAVNGDVFVSSGESHGCVRLKLVPDANDSEKFNPTEVWASQGVKSVMRNEWQTSVLMGEFLYGFDNVGSAGQITHLTCVNAATGERVWQELRFGKGNLIAADGKLFMSTMKGELIIAKASPTGYTELGRATVMDTTRQAPVLSGGLLYLRDNNQVLCLSVEEHESN